MKAGMLLFLACFAVGAEELVIPHGQFTARFENGTLVGLTDTAGHVLVQQSEAVKGACVHRLAGDEYATGATTLEPWHDGKAAQRYEGLATSTLETTYALDEDTGDLVLSQRGTSDSKGVCGVEWAIERIPLDMNIIVPVTSGQKLTRSTPGALHTYDYPITWEAQLVIVEGDGYGFYVWAEDAKGVFKRLVVERDTRGWRLGFVTMPYAPFEEQSSCESVRWHVNVYEGDWCVPAAEFRQWAVEAFKPTPVEEQQPAWVGDMRCCVIMGLDMDALETLPARLDPAQTLLYVPSWRKAGYDRDYPTYDEPFETLGPLVERAHALGFRVMLHVNYFGCDPLNASYEQFEPYQLRSPWGTHEKDWWLWTRADPVIKFAYINPACAAWRDMLTDRFVTLCETYDVDALHLDQTLCLYNDYNGLIDGMSMIDGTLALHRQLREALPDVALSGEGLNEITYRYEAFAQRHVVGINHVDGTFSKSHLALAHPISSFLLRPYTVMYGYLGYPGPAGDQMYAAWNEAYRYYGVIPTARPNTAAFEAPTGFWRQFFDEAAFWQGERLTPDTNSGWPKEVCFPYRTQDGRCAVRLEDGRFMCGKREISRTITGVSEIALPGTIEGWCGYDEARLLGLDPGVWYPYVQDPRDENVLHVAGIAPGYALGCVDADDTLACVRTRRTAATEIRFASLLGDAVCGSRPFDGEPTEVRGELQAPDGAAFNASGDTIHAHPPWRVHGTGTAYARFGLTLPKDATRFVSDVALDHAAVGSDKSDGVLFGVEARGDDDVLRAECHNATATRKTLALDVAKFAGRDITLELSIDPGPERSPSFDWARWYGARIERAGHDTGMLRVAGARGYGLALSGEHATELDPADKRHDVQAIFPGGAYLLAEKPSAAELPVDLAKTPFRTSFVGDTGIVLDSPLHANAVATESVAEGIGREGLFMHPPNHGSTTAAFMLTLPETSAEFHAFIGIRDNAETDGVVYRIEVCGLELFRKETAESVWEEVTCDLSPWAGKPVVMSLVVDSDGNYNCDWAHWGEPVIRAK